MSACEFEVVYSGALEHARVVGEQLRFPARPTRPRQTKKARRAATEVVARAMRRRRGYPWTAHEIRIATDLSTQQVTGAIATLIRLGEVVRAEAVEHRLPGRYRWLGHMVIS